MADPIADNPELAVDELKRKARRRLIGAIVLALAAATLLPLLFEQEQRPLGEDVSVQIPPVDEGKFVGRLTGEKAKDAAPEPRADARAEGKGDVRPESKADARSESKADARSESKADAKSESKAISRPEPQTGARGEAKAETKAETKSEPKAGARPEPAPAAPEAQSASPAAPPAPSEPKAAATAGDGTATADADRPKVEGFIVQLGAFTDAYGANALSNRLKKAGYPAYTESTDTSRGKLWRVRVGGYPSRAAAAEARDKLKADGHNGIVSAAK
jgi:DedD protein